VSGVREAAKRAANAAALAVMTPAILSFRVRAALIGENRAIEGSTQALAWMPGVAGQYLRRAFLRRALAHCAVDATIEYGTIFSQAGARIESGAYVGPRCHLGLVHVGRDALIAAGVHVPSGGATHDISRTDIPIRDQPHHRSIVRLGAGSWIGSASVVMADIGAHTVVGAGSVVTRPLPAYAIAVGSPAKVVRMRVATDVATA
jgi:acetyltransferase-like isoleucine patch superfamily enzyme